MSSPSTIRPSDLSVVARQCIAAICLQRFCAQYAIQHPAIDAFIEHLWGVATVTSETFSEWESRFQELPASTWRDDLPADIVCAMAPSVLADYEELADAAIECSASTWYCDDIPGTLAAFQRVLTIMDRHKIPLPKFDVFRSSSPSMFQGWGSPLTREQVREWRVQA